MTGLDLLSNDWLSLRDISRLLLLSALFTGAALLAFPRNAPTRRALLLWAVTALTVIPVLMTLQGTWAVELDELPTLTLATGIPNLLVMGWLVVSAVLGINLVLSVRTEIRQISELQEIDSATVKTQLLELCRVAGIAPPKVRVGDLACSVSMREATIILPPDWQNWDHETLRGVLAHEIVHIARRDDVWLLVMRGLTIAYWWMPWLRKLDATYTQVMEESCDDAASELIGHDVSYVSALVKAAAVNPSAGADLKFTTAMHAHHLVGRVGRFTDHRFVELDTAGVYWCVITIIVFVGLATSFEPVQKLYPQPYRDQVLFSPISAPLTEVTEPEVAQPSFYPVVHDHVELPSGLSELDRDRVHNPEYEPPVIYPGSAIRKRLEGEVVIHYRVGRDGAVTHALVASSSDSSLAQAALRAVKQIRYAPGFTTGRLIRTTKDTQPHIEVRRVFRFRMQSEP